MTQQITGDVTLLTLKKHLETPLCFSADQRVTFDFSQVGQIDSSLLSYILHIIRQSIQLGASISFVGLPSNFTELTKLYGIDSLLQAYITPM